MALGIVDAANVAAAPLLTALAYASTYGPTEFGADATAGAGTIMLWVGAGAGAAIVVMLGLIGLRRGVAAFRSMAR